MANARFISYRSNLREYKAFRDKLGAGEVVFDEEAPRFDGACGNLGQVGTVYVSSFYRRLSPQRRFVAGARFFL
jgi:hypothetical protein